MLTDKSDPSYVHMGPIGTDAIRIADEYLAKLEFELPQFNNTAGEPVWTQMPTKYGLERNKYTSLSIYGVKYVVRTHYYESEMESHMPGSDVRALYQCMYRGFFAPQTLYEKDNSVLGLSRSITS